MFGCLCLLSLIPQPLEGFVGLGMSVLLRLQETTLCRAVRLLPRRANTQPEPGHLIRGRSRYHLPQLGDAIRRFAGGLAAKGFSKGDVLAIVPAVAVSVRVIGALHGGVVVPLLRDAEGELSQPPLVQARR